LSFQLSEAQEELRKLRFEKENLQKLVDEQDYLLKKKDQGKFQKQIETKKEEIVSRKTDSNDLYTVDHEIARRSLDTNIHELYYYLFSYIEKHNSPELSAFADRTLDQVLALLAESQNFWENVDDAKNWHRNELSKLTDKIQKRLEELQNPPDCTQANLLVCDLNKGCGFGCQLHHVAYCFLVSAAANRTMVLVDDGRAWRYSNDGWEAVFKPVGKCKYANSGISDSVHWSGINQKERVVKLPIVDGLANRPDQLPLSFPKQIRDTLLKHHSNPPVYFVSQFIWYLMRHNDHMTEILKKAEAKIPFGQGPIVGLQIRRTDKIGTEAAFHSLAEYMKWTEHWFRIQELRNDTKIERKIFIATDDPEVFKEAREKYPNYKVYGDSSIAETAQMGSRYTDSSLYGVITDIQMLARCDYLVCTFSSQVCRMGFELMQIRYGDAGHLFHSLDDIYYYGGQHPHEEIAVLSHTPQNRDEIELKVGVKVGIAGNHWDGYSKGNNRDTKKTGLYPSYKTREFWRIVDFPLFENL